MTSHPIRIGAAGGEYMESVLVTEWNAAVGERVLKGHHLLTVETAKAATEVEAESDGWLAQISVASGEEVTIDTVLGRLVDTQEELDASETRESEPNAADEQPASTAVAEMPTKVDRSTRVMASPLARRVAAQRGVSLEGIAGTGPRGRIKLRDLPAADESQSRSSRPASPSVLGGRNVPLVLLHGFGADGASWRMVRGVLPPEIMSHALDLPGHGREAERPALTLTQIISDLSGRLEEFGLSEIHLAGHSLGGAAALGLVASGRQIVRSLTLIAPAGLGTSVNAGFLAGLVQADTPEALQVWLDEMVADPSVLPHGFAEAAIAQSQRLGTREPLWRMMHNLFPGGKPAFDLAAECAAVEVPLRLIWGREDKIIPYHDIHAAPVHAALHRLPGIGHVPQLEAAALTARLLTETVRSAG